MPKATWKGIVLAESHRVKLVERSYYFPPDSLNRQYFKDSDIHSVCPYKGRASYYDVVVNGSVNEAAAWYYPRPKSAAADIAGYVAFWKGIRIED